MTAPKLRLLCIGSFGVIVCFAAISLCVGYGFVGMPGGKLTRELVLASIERQWPGVHQITANELAVRLATDDNPPLLIDTRSWEEYAVSHLPGAVWAESPSQICAAVAEVPQKRDVVLYCSVGMRSSKAAAMLLKDGRRNVYNLRGSIFQWANEGRVIEHEGKKVGSVHPYNRIWGLLLDPKLHPKSAQ